MKEWLAFFFFFDGRINRKAYWLRGVLVLFVGTVVVYGVIVMLVSSVMVGQVSSRAQSTPEHDSVNLVLDQAGNGVLVMADRGAIVLPVDRLAVVGARNRETVDLGIAVGTLDLGPEIADSGTIPGRFSWTVHPEDQPQGRQATEPKLGLGASISMTMATVLQWVWGVLQTWASLAIAVKRAHDRGRSGWFVLVGLIPIVGGLWLLVELGFLKGTDGDNAYGPDPLQAAS